MTVFTRTLAILIAGGIPVPESTQISVETFNNKYFRYQVKDVPQKIREGKLLSDVLTEVAFVPPVLVEVIRVGESSGNLVDVLNENADAFENSIDAKISSLISLIEPVLIVVLGLVIAFMLVSIYLPIFNTVNVVR
jgi:type IV pilus assembly protein PilC